MGVQYTVFPSKAVETSSLSSDAGLDLNGRLQPENVAFEGNILDAH